MGGMRSAEELAGALFGGVDREDLPVAPTPNSQPLGQLTGAPPRTQLFTRMIGPAIVEIVGESRQSRTVTLTAPNNGFSIFIGDSNVDVNNGIALTAGVPYQVDLPGFQPLYAVTNAPVLMALKVQVAAIFSGDRERRP